MARRERGAQEGERGGNYQVDPHRSGESMVIGRHGTRAGLTGAMTKVEAYKGDKMAVRRYISRDRAPERTEMPGWRLLRGETRRSGLGGSFIINPLCMAERGGGYRAYVELLMR